MSSAFWKVSGNLYQKVGATLLNDHAPCLFVFSPNPGMVITILVCTVTRSGENEVDCVEKQVPEDICMYGWMCVTMCVLIIIGCTSLLVVF